MMMSVFHQGGRTRQLDHLACIDIAVDTEAAEMILFAVLNNRSILVGLEDGEAIIKPLEAGDTSLSFEILYDSCISLREYRKMMELKLKSPSEFPPALYETEIVAQIGFAPRVRLRLRAKDDVAVRALLLRLINEDLVFREHLVRRFVSQIIDHDDVDLASRGALKVDDVAPGEASEWQFLDDD
jgi:hypothetical protein